MTVCTRASVRSLLKMLVSLLMFREGQWVTHLPRTDATFDNDPSCWVSLGWQRACWDWRGATTQPENAEQKKTELLELGRTVGTGCLLIDFCHEDASRTCFFFFWYFRDGVSVAHSLNARSGGIFCMPPRSYRGRFVFRSLTSERVPKKVGPHVMCWNYPSGSFSYVSFSDELKPSTKSTTRWAPRNFLSPTKWLYKWVYVTVFLCFHPNKWSPWSPIL